MAKSTSAPAMMACTASKPPWARNCGTSRACTLTPIRCSRGTSSTAAAASARFTRTRWSSASTPRPAKSCGACRLSFRFGAALPCKIAGYSSASGTAIFLRVPRNRRGPSCASTPPPAGATGKPTPATAFSRAGRPGRRLLRGPRRLLFLRRSRRRQGMLEARPRQSRGRLTALTGDGSHLLAITTEGKVCCLDTKTGAIAWTFDVAMDTGQPQMLFSSPLVLNRRQAAGEVREIYFGSGSAIFAQDAPQLEELRGRKAWELLVVPDDAHLVQEAFEQLHRGEPSVQLDMRLRTKSQDERRISLTFTSLPDAVGKPSSIIASGIDITEAIRCVRGHRSSIVLLRR